MRTFSKSLCLTSRETGKIQVRLGVWEQYVNRANSQLCFITRNQLKMWDIVWDELLTHANNWLNTRIMRSMYTDTISAYMRTKKHG
jgi:hypothetical protein